MTSSSLAGHNDSKTVTQPSVSLEQHQKLKQSLPVPLINGAYYPQSDAPTADQGLSVKQNDVQAQRSTRPSSLLIRPPERSVTGGAAFAALQFLPTPVLVLSSLKTVVLANEAMGRLLGSESKEDLGLFEDEEDISTLDILYGKTLSQIGVEMVQDGQTVWTRWEVSIFHRLRV